MEHTTHRPLVSGPVFDLDVEGQGELRAGETDAVFRLLKLKEEGVTFGKSREASVAALQPMSGTRRNRGRTA